MRGWAAPFSIEFFDRLFLIEVVSSDWNCSRYITPRFTEAEVEAHMAPLKARIAEVEGRLRA